ncbi:MAG: hypothetical protein MJ014_00195 [Methanocorpusculum sp.]|nr:hypothetical protein [Methanocorpusculum sp.]
MTDMAVIDESLSDKEANMRMRRDIVSIESCTKECLYILRRQEYLEERHLWYDKWILRCAVAMVILEAFEILFEHMFWWGGCVC